MIGHTQRFKFRHSDKWLKCYSFIVCWWISDDFVLIAPDEVSTTAVAMSWKMVLEILDNESITEIVHFHPKTVNQTTYNFTFSEKSLNISHKYL